jgi:hypothetical protein
MGNDLFDGRDDANRDQQQPLHVGAPTDLPGIDWYLVGPLLVAVVAFLTYPLRLALDHFIGFAPLTLQSGLGLWLLTVGIAVAGVGIVKTARVIQ